ncbi:hypothetical protein M501DRAFT_1002532 [Patellaria atrata CBS 101060]|uniref:Uncharacterized protein n=1 Tax=Patellaria atrata CBS 101060 TaxID=1346257 RepID=A0A9P4VSU1_9PEZI|nr:hypothetical protein M501DRAFT_1002532 [Patellaria atrata CBS 101060]
MTKLLDHAWSLKLRKESKRKWQNSVSCSIKYSIAKPLDHPRHLYLSGLTRDKWQLENIDIAV